MEEKSTKKNIFAKVFSIVAMVILGLCVITVLYTTISYSKNGKVDFFGYSFHVIQTESMEPDIKVGDLVVVKSVPYDEIHVGDDILFKCEDTTSQVYGRYIVHRVIELTETEGVYKTKGINSPGPDKVPSKAEGKAISVNSSWGSVFSFLTNWRSVLIVIAIAGMVIFTIFQVFAVVSNASKLMAQKDSEKLKNDTELKEKLKNELLEEMKKQADDGSETNDDNSSSESKEGNQDDAEKTEQTTEQDIIKDKDGGDE